MAFAHRVAFSVYSKKEVFRVRLRAPYVRIGALRKELVHFHRAVSSMSRAVSSMCRADSSMCRAVSSMRRAVTSMCPLDTLCMLEHCVLHAKATILCVGISLHVLLKSAFG